MLFSTAGIEISPLVPLATSFFLTLIMSSAGVSGAFMLLPFQVSVLGFTSPAATATNHMFNVLAIPGGLIRYIKDGRMLWPLAAVMLAGTLPGVLLGSLARIYLLSNPGDFKLFMGIVLAFIGVRLAAKAISAKKKNKHDELRDQTSKFEIEVHRFDLKSFQYTFMGESFSLSPVSLALLSLVVGCVGGAYGVGGGAILSPVLIGFYRLPVHTTAGATLLCTWVSSLTADIFFLFLSSFLDLASVSPDWLLGLLFGVGGVLGMYAGAAFQSKLPAKLIEIVLATAVLALASMYLSGIGA